MIDRLINRWQESANKYKGLNDSLAGICRLVVSDLKKLKQYYKFEITLQKPTNAKK